MSRNIKGLLILVALLGGMAIYAWWYYNRPQLQDPTYQKSIPERAQEIRQRTGKEPMKQFERKMDQRLDDASSRGIELRGSPTPVPDHIRIPPAQSPTAP